MSEEITIGRAMFLEHVVTDQERRETLVNRLHEIGYKDEHNRIDLAIGHDLDGMEIALDVLEEGGPEAMAQWITEYTGVLYDPSKFDLAEAIDMLNAVVERTGKQPDEIFLGPQQYADLEEHLVQRASYKDCMGLAGMTKLEVRGASVRRGTDQEHGSYIPKSYMRRRR